MRSFARILLIALLLGYPLFGEGPECPSWIYASDIPSCPMPNSSALLPDNYPALAHVVSDLPTMRAAKETGEEFAKAYTLTVLESSGTRVPLIFLPVEGKTFAAIQKEIGARTKGDLSKQKQWLKSLVHVPHGRFTWQQDYFEAFTDFSSKKTLLRAVPNYKRGNSTSALFSAMSDACKEILPHKELDDTHASENLSANAGGNMESLPGGLCLHGKNQPSEYAKQYCGAQENEVIINTDWLSVGHVDEIVGMVPKPKESFPCNFALTFASPAKGLSALKSPETQNDFFFGHPDKKRREEAWQKGLANLCDEMNRKKPQAFLPRSRAPLRKNQTRHGEHDDFPGLEDLTPLLEEISARLDEIELKIAPKSCADVTNKQVHDFFSKKPQWFIAQELIQKEMDEIKKNVMAKVQARLPACKIEALDVPYLFETGSLIENEAAPAGTPNYLKYGLPLEKARSLIPNVTNAVVAEDSLLVPEPHNAAFKKQILAAYKKTGANVKFVDTYHYAHVGDGNLHCATHTLRTCR